MSIIGKINKEWLNNIGDNETVVVWLRQFMEEKFKEGEIEKIVLDRNIPKALINEKWHHFRQADLDEFVIDRQTDVDGCFVNYKKAAFN